MKKILLCALISSICYAAPSIDEQLYQFTVNFTQMAPKEFNRIEIWYELEHLLSQGASFDLADISVNALHSTGVSLLYCTCKIGLAPLAQLLLENNANPNSQDVVLYNTPLHAAAKHGHIQIIELLCSHQARLDVRNIHGCTPLHIAVKHHQSDAVQVLLSHGANRQIRDQNGKTAEEYARARGYDEIIALFTVYQD